MITHMTQRAFTLIETMVAVSILAIAIVSPITLAQRSLQASYHARDQVIASYLGQEAIEAVRAIRDHNLMEQLAGSAVDTFEGIPTSGSNFLVDTRANVTFTTCTTAPLYTDGLFYAYGADPCAPGAGWTATNIRRTVSACYVQPNSGNCHPTATEEVRVTVTVTWTSGVFGSRTIVTTANLYRIPTS